MAVWVAANTDLDLGTAWIDAPRVVWTSRGPVALRPGDEITAEVEVLEAREDKPLTKLRTTIVNQDGTVVLDGSALVWTEPL